MECRDRLEGYLRENGVPFEVQHHPRAITPEVAATERVPRKMVAKVVMVIRRRDGGVVAAGSLSSRPGEGGQSAGSGKGASCRTSRLFRGSIPQSKKGWSL
jgi:hypothetical protein